MTLTTVMYGVDSRPISTLYCFTGDVNATPRSDAFSPTMCHTVRSGYPVTSAVSCATCDRPLHLLVDAGCSKYCIHYR